MKISVKRIYELVTDQDTGYGNRQAKNKNDDKSQADHVIIS
jgi:hypothetical protein